MIQRERKICRTQGMTKIILCHEKVKMVKLSLCTPCKYIEGDEAQLYSFLTLVEDGGDWSTLCPSHFTPGEGIPTSHLRGGWVGPVGWDSIVAIVTCYRLDSTGIKFPWGWGFLHPSRLGLGPTQSLIQGILGLSGVEWLRHGVDHPLHLPQRLKKEHSLLILWTFMACSRVNITITSWVDPRATLQVSKYKTVSCPCWKFLLNCQLNNIHLACDRPILGASRGWGVVVGGNNCTYN